MTSLSWLQGVSIFPNVNQQTPLQTQEKIEELEDKEGTQKSQAYDPPVVAVRSDLFEATNNLNSDIDKDDADLTKEEEELSKHSNDTDTDVLSEETTRQILNKKIQIQQRTSVKNLCLHYSYLSKVKILQQNV